MLRVSAHSTYNASEYAFAGLEGYWDFKQTKFEGMDGPVVLNQWYKLQMATKLKGGNSKEGSMYHDITRCRPALDSEIPQGSAPDGHTASPEGNGGYQGGGEYWGANNGAGNMAFDAAVTVSAADVFSNNDEMIKVILERRRRLYYEVILQPIEEAQPASAEDLRAAVASHAPLPEPEPAYDGQPQEELTF